MTTTDHDAHPLFPDEEFPLEALPYVPEDDHTGDGHDWVRNLPPGWTLVTSWGSEGWTLGNPPYVYVAHCDSIGNVYGLAVYVEGDVTVNAYGSRALRDAHTDEFALNNWLWLENGPLEGLPPKDTPAASIPARFRGPYRPDRDPVALARQAVEDRTVRHGKHVANLLREHGYTDHADRVDREVSARKGHLSARQAVHFLARGGV